MTFKMPVRGQHVVNKERLKIEFIESLRSNKGFKTYACHEVGISFQTYSNWCKEDPDFAHKASEEAEIGRQEMTDIAEQKLLEAIENGDLRAVMFYLKTRAKDRGYSEKFEPNNNKQQQNSGHVEISRERLKEVAEAYLEDTKNES